MQTLTLKQKLQDSSEIASLIAKGQWEVLSSLSNDAWIVKVKTSIRTSVVKLMHDEIGYHWSRGAARLAE